LSQCSGRKVIKIETLDSRLERVEGQMQESTGFIKALVHQSEYQKAQMDALTHTTARVEGRLNQGFKEMDERFTGSTNSTVLLSVSTAQG